MSRELSLFVAGFFFAVGCCYAAVFVAWLPRPLYRPERRRRVLWRCGTMAVVAYLACLGMLL